MKKNIIVYLLAVIALILVNILVYSLLGEISLIMFVIVNLILPSLVIIVSNALINYDISSNIRRCLLHAVVLAMISMIINLGTTQIMGNKVDAFIESEEAGKNEEYNQEILDELDRQAREEMINRGLISEDEEIYSEPYTNNGDSDVKDESDISDEQLTGTWDVQIEKENTLSTVTGIFFDILLAFIGGMLGMKLSNKKEKLNNSATV